MFIKWDYSIRFPNWFFGHGMSDYPMWILQCNIGRFGFINQCMSVHRRTDEGSYNFSNRFEYWRYSKPGWISLDKQLIHYFSENYNNGSILDALRLRERDDWAKYLKGVFEICPSEEIARTIQQSSSDIQRIFHLPLFTTSPFGLRCTKYLIKTFAPLPPYKVNAIARRIRKKRLKAEQEMIELL